jgi:hypothetical protein
MGYVLTVCWVGSAMAMGILAIFNQPRDLFVAVFSFGAVVVGVLIFFLFWSDNQSHKKPPK